MFFKFQDSVTYVQILRSLYFMSYYNADWHIRYIWGQALMQESEIFHTLSLDDFLQIITNRSFREVRRTKATMICYIACYIRLAGNNGQLIPLEHLYMTKNSSEPIHAKEFIWTFVPGRPLIVGEICGFFHVASMIPHIIYFSRKPPLLLSVQS